MKYLEKVDRFIESLEGDYADRLNLITEKIKSFKLEGDFAEADQLLEYGQSLIERRHSEGEDSNGFRSLELESNSQEDPLGVSSFYQNFEGAMSAIFDGKLELAKEILEAIQDDIDFIDKGVEGLKRGDNIKSFQSLTEEVIYRIKTKDDEAQILNPELQIYLSIFGALLLDLKEYSRAVEILDLALMANPISGANLLAMSKAKRLLGEEEESRDYNHLAFKRAYLVGDIAESFANEAYFLYKDGKPSLSLALNFMALEFEEENSTAQGNMVLLKNKFPNAELATKDEYISYLKKNGLPTDLDQETLSILRMLGQKAEEEGNLDLALDIYSNLDQLINDPSLHEKIHKLLPRYEEEHGAFIQHLSGHKHDHNCSCGHEHMGEGEHSHTCCDHGDGQDHDCTCGHEHH